MHPETLFNLEAWMATLLNTVVALVVYARRRTRREASTSSLVAALQGLSAAALCCFAEEVFVLAGAGPFGAIRLAQYNLAVPTAAIGVVMLIDGARLRDQSRRVGGLLTGLALMAPSVVIAYAAFIAPYHLQVERVDVEVEAIIDASAPIRVVLLADLQADRVAEHENTAIDLALAEKPDLILMPGDLFHVSGPRWDDRKSQFLALVDRIRAPFGVVAVQGNVDPLLRLRPFLEASPIRLLENEVIIVDVRGTRVAIAGVELDFTSRRAEAAIAELTEADADVRILMAHYPDAIEQLRDIDGVDLLVAGHTHGGQVVIPGFGPPMTLTGVPRAVAAGGLHEMYGRQIYVSRGIGMERGAAPPVRFFCPPEVSVLSLR